MLRNKSVLAVIQARGGSKGIPSKNIYPLNGHPLIAYTIAAAKGSRYVDRLVVTTDSDEIASVGEAYGAEAPFRRPAELAGDTVASVDSLHHAVAETERITGKQYEIIVELPCVAPLRTAEDIDGALEKLVDTGANSVISMANTGEKHPVRLKRIVDDQIEDFCAEYPEPAKGSRRQDLEPCFIRNGAIYSMTRSTLMDLFSRHGPDSRPYVMPDERSINIDGWMDLRMVDLMIRDGQCANRPRLLRTDKVEVFERTGPEILVTAPLYFLPGLRQRIVDRANCVLAHEAPKEEVAKLLKSAEGWLCSPAPVYPIDEELLRDADKLKVIATPSTGTTHIDLDYCARRNIEVISLKGSPVVGSITASSEFSFALLLAMVRKLPYAFDAARRGSWRDIEEQFRGIELGGKVLGIIGYGRIGGNLSRYARAIGMEVVAFDPNVAQMPDARRAETVQQVLRAADVVAICVHLDEKTRGMVTDDWFAQMKPESYFLNTSRGEVVDEAAMLRALEKGKLAAAAVDVITGEQSSEISDHPVIRYARSHDNLIVTPHMAGLTVDSEMKAGSYAFEALSRRLSENVLEPSA